MIELSLSRSRGPGNWTDKVMIRESLKRYLGLPSIWRRNRGLPDVENIPRRYATAVPVPSIFGIMLAVVFDVLSCNSLLLQLLTFFATLYRGSFVGENTALP